MHQHEPENEQRVVQRSAVNDVLRASGRPLDEVTRVDMENRLGHDFSNVRIHDDGAAQRSAAAIQARAYTSGHHVVLGEGGNDRHTLAHELTHVIQQRQGVVAGTDSGDGLRMSDPSDRFERAAEANAHRALSSGLRPGPVAEPESAGDAVRGPAVQRIALADALDMANRSIPATDAIPEDDFRKTILLPLGAIAAKQGKDLPGYLQDLDEARFVSLFKNLRSGFQAEDGRPSITSRMAKAAGSDPLAELDPSAKYPGLLRLPGTALLVSVSVISELEPEKEKARTFIRDYRAGRLNWFRGLGIAHFSWDALKQGVVTSEGTDDIPSFTMGDGSSSRWLPGDSAMGIPAGIAQGVDRENSGLRQVAYSPTEWPGETSVLVPTGAVVRMDVTNTTPVAYLNSGEQLLRGPITTGVQIHEIWGNDPLMNEARSVPGPHSFADLPGRAPWAADTAGIQAWKAGITAWARKYGRS